MVEVCTGYHGNRMAILLSLGGRRIVRKGFMEMARKLSLKDRINQRVGGGPQVLGGHFQTEHSMSNKSKDTKMRNSLPHTENQRQTGVAGAQSVTKGVA